MAASLRIVQVRSANGASPAQRATLRSLGLRRIGSTTERPDHPALRGMVRSVAHLVEISDAESREKSAVGG
jgi:large subunit ribosomal protein L30